MDINQLLTELNKCNWTWEFARIYNILKELVYKGATFRQIEENCYFLTVYKIIDYLVRYNEGENLDPVCANAIINYYNTLNINQERCIVIADNHMGRLEFEENENDYNRIFYKNERGLHNAYNYAIKNNISNVINLGDIIEGNAFGEQKRLTLKGENQHQLEYFKRAYPNSNSIKTFLLFGNHEYDSILHDGLNSKFYKVIPSIELIGINYTYINFCGYRLKLSHENKQTESFKNLHLKHELTLTGHSHNHALYEDIRIFKVPSISSIYYDDGFIELINEEKVFRFRYIDGYGRIDNTKEKILSKSTNF